MKRQDREVQVARMTALREAASERLRGLPNVRTVGVGLRIRGGRVTDELTFRVYVTTKLPSTELSPSDLIPEMIDGIPTDVIQIGRTQKLCWAKGIRPLVGGIEITESPFDTLSSGGGTLGCIVTRADGKLAALSCEHVLLFKQHTDRRVYQPHYDECLGFRCNKIGETVDGTEQHFEYEGTSFWIDCAIALLDDGVDRMFRLRRVIQKVVAPPIEVSIPAGIEGKVWVEDSGKVVAIEDENGVAVDRTKIKEPAVALPGTLVWKVGNRTGLTVGIVEDALGTVVSGPNDDENHNVVLIRALAGYEASGTRKFADQGDSGSIVLDLSNRVVGVVTGLYEHHNTEENVDELFVYACNIDPVLAYLKATINLSPDSASPSAATGDVVEEEEIEDIDFGQRLHALEAQVRATRLGPVLLTLIERHGDEIYNLINSRRAVTLAWHRNRGPAFVALFARSIAEPSRDFPFMVDTTSLRSMLMSMVTVLHSHASQPLSSDLDIYGGWFINLFDECKNVPDMLRRLEELWPLMSQEM